MDLREGLFVAANNNGTGNLSGGQMQLLQQQDGLLVEKDGEWYLGGIDYVFDRFHAISPFTTANIRSLTAVGSRLFAATFDGVWYSDSPQVTSSWVKVDDKQYYDIDSDGDTVMAIGKVGFVKISYDAGETWITKNHGGGSDTWTGVSIEGDLAFICCNKEKPRVSYDKGQHWALCTYFPFTPNHKNNRSNGCAVHGNIGVVAGGIGHLTTLDLDAKSVIYDQRGDATWDNFSDVIWTDRDGFVVPGSNSPDHENEVAFELSRNGVDWDVIPHEVLPVELNLRSILYAGNTYVLPCETGKIIAGPDLWDLKEIPNPFAGVLMLGAERIEGAYYIAGNAGAFAYIYPDYGIFVNKTGTELFPVTMPDGETYSVSIDEVEKLIPNANIEILAAPVIELVSGRKCQKVSDMEVGAKIISGQIWQVKILQKGGSTRWITHSGSSEDVFTAPKTYEDQEVLGARLEQGMTVEDGRTAISFSNEISFTTSDDPTLPDGWDEACEDVCYDGWLENLKLCADDDSECSQAAWSAYIDCLYECSAGKLTREQVEAQACGKLRGS
jgi:uncharacterized spore protein YtfJ